MGYYVAKFTCCRNERKVVFERHQWLGQLSQIGLQRTGDGFALPLERVFESQLFCFPPVQPHAQQLRNLGIDPNNSVQSLLLKACVPTKSHYEHDLQVRAQRLNSPLASRVSMHFETNAKPTSSSVLSSLFVTFPGVRYSYNEIKKITPTLKPCFVYLRVPFLP
jgi:hypothetical protein